MVTKTTPHQQRRKAYRSHVVNTPSHTGKSYVNNNFNDCLSHCSTKLGHHFSQSNNNHHHQNQIQPYKIEKKKSKYKEFKIKPNKLCKIKQSYKTGLIKALKHKNAHGKELHLEKRVSATTNRKKETTKS